MRFYASEVTDIAHDDCPECSALTEEAMRMAFAGDAPATRVILDGGVVTHRASVSQPRRLDEGDDYDA